VGIELFGRAFDDAKLVGLAYSYEQATHHRRAPALTPALGARTAVPLMTWRSTGAGSSAGSRIQADYTFEPTTNELKYTLAVTGFKAGEVMAAAFHRKSKGDIGPVFALLTNHGFEKLAGAETLSSTDRDNLMAGSLYLEITTQSGAHAVRLPLKPANLP
jgi:hypothetical protein